MKRAALTASTVAAFVVVLVSAGAAGHHRQCTGLRATHATHEQLTTNGCEK